MDTESGFGIKNTIQRLHLLYGKEASLNIRNENDGIVLTELIIPKGTPGNEDLTQNKNQSI
jgi:sensor histidine kinase YesM